MDAMSMPCHLLQACVQGAGVGQEREPNQICSWHFPRHEHASLPIKMPIIFIETRSSHS
jgi:hypothetical protein